MAKDKKKKQATFDGMKGPEEDQPIEPMDSGKVPESEEPEVPETVSPLPAMELIQMLEFDVVYYETGGPRVNLLQQLRVLAKDAKSAESFGKFWCEDKGYTFLEVVEINAGLPPPQCLNVRKGSKSVEVGVYELVKPNIQVVIP